MQHDLICCVTRGSRMSLRSYDRERWGLQQAYRAKDGRQLSNNILFLVLRQSLDIDLQSTDKGWNQL